jgi:hypothetical protein
MPHVPDTEYVRVVRRLSAGGRGADYLAVCFSLGVTRKTAAERLAALVRAGAVRRGRSPDRAGAAVFTVPDPPGEWCAGGSHI